MTDDTCVDCGKQGPEVMYMDEQNIILCAPCLLDREMKEISLHVAG